MKIFYAVFFLLLSNMLLAQTQDLYTLARGEYVGFNALMDRKENLYGYVALYNYGKSGDKTKKFEYVILDKNLNPVANKEFEGDITAANYFGYINFNQKMVLAPIAPDYTFVKPNNFFIPRSVEVDLATNTPSTKIYYDYENGTFTEIAQPKKIKDVRKETRGEKKEKGYNYNSNVYEIAEGGYIVTEYNDYGSYITNNSIIKFDKDRKEMWRYRYNANADKKNGEDLAIVEKDQQYIYAILGKKVNDEKQFSLLVLDMQTGKEVHNKPITSLSPETLDNINNYYSYTTNINNSKTFDDKIVMVGHNYDNKKKNLGFARLIIDKKTFSTDARVIGYSSDFTKFLPSLTANNTFADGYELRTKDFFFLENGSVGILMEKYKPESAYTLPKTTDLVYAFTDADFRLKDVRIMAKDMSKGYMNDYLFSQYLNNGRDVVFFYRDLQKDDKTKQKNWKLFINTFIDGKFKQEEIQISEKDAYTILPYVGKEGYILLREYNTKDKFNKIRLERLNY